MKNFFNNFLFLSPSLTIKQAHLNKRDVRNIKYSLAHKMGAACLLLAIVHLLLNIALFLSMGINTGWKTAEKYGTISLVAQILSIVGAIFVITCEIISLKAQNAKVKRRFSIIGSEFLFVFIAIQLFFSFIADVQMGYLVHSETLSASITLISLLVIVQPVFWSAAAVLDGSVSIGLIVLSVYSSVKYNVQGLIYYLMIALVFPIACYIFISILFYAETLRYCELLRNEILNNEALYDELTRCKNRYALADYLKESARRWSNKECNLLMLMFDIDSFKLYNDQYSHLAGDYCLKAITEAVRKEFPAPDLDFYRYGGEEFLLFFELENKKEAESIMKRIRICVKNLKIKSAKEAPFDIVTVSVGGIFLRANATFNYEENLTLVDRFLYKAKNNGKDLCVLNGDILPR